MGSGPHLPERLESDDANANGSHKAIDVKICGAFGHFVLRMPGCQLVQGRRLGGIGVGMPQVFAKDTNIKSFGETERIATGLSVGTTSEHVFQPKPCARCCELDFLPLLTLAENGNIKDMQYPAENILYTVYKRN